MVNKAVRILLVEDERRISAYVKRGLEEAGHAVDAVYSGVEALDWADTGNYDVMVLDVLLPGVKVEPMTGSILGVETGED